MFLFFFVSIILGNDLVMLDKFVRVLKTVGRWNKFLKKKMFSVILEKLLFVLVKIVKI